MDVPPERKPERGYIRMFPRDENRHEGTSGCCPGTKTGTRARSHVPPERKPKRGHICQNHPFTKPPCCFLSKLKHYCCLFTESLSLWSAWLTWDWCSCLAWPCLWISSSNQVWKATTMRPYAQRAQRLKKLNPDWSREPEQCKKGNFALQTCLPSNDSEGVGMANRSPLKIRILCSAQRAQRLKTFDPDWSREIFNPYAWDFQSRLKTSIPILIIPHKRGRAVWLAWNFQSRLKFTIWDWSLESFNPGAKSWFFFESLGPLGGSQVGSSQTWLFQSWLFATFTRKRSFALISVSLKRCSPPKVFGAFLKHFWRIFGWFLTTHFGTDVPLFPTKTRPILAHVWRILDAFLTRSCYCWHLFREHFLDDTESFACVLFCGRLRSFALFRAHLRVSASDCV